MKIKDPLIRSRIGLVIRLERKKRGLSQKALSDKLSVTRTYLNQIEVGKRVPSLILLELIAVQFGTVKEDLLDKAKTGALPLKTIQLKMIIEKIIDSDNEDKIRKLFSFVEALDKQ